MSLRNGRPEPEVIVNYSDGFSYSKGKLEEGYREIADKVPVKPHKDPAVGALKKEDIDLVMTEFEIPRSKAEKILVENGSDVKKALEALVYGA
ncbi:hypothetical protein FA13DRAFT_1692777 [Coprinellus micaceus]|uniref:Nascent polypeptide-associated complex subunit alpha-like UBA domain-containing protein n=1 Tax=Coprinellus micaceus TaxID=71717 RepID=A0A4Y7SXL8_COPMI|nr:hypothetical protein FA13DRAFT_1692777 [Coprinellus micaceus]